MKVLVLHVQKYRDSIVAHKHSHMFTVIEVDGNPVYVDFDVQISICMIYDFRQPNSKDEKQKKERDKKA